MPLLPVVPAPVPPGDITGTIVRAGESVRDQRPERLSLDVSMIEPHLHPIHQDVWQRDAGDADGPVPECSHETEANQQAGNRAGEQGNE